MPVAANINGVNIRPDVQTITGLFASRSDTFTEAGNGVTVDCSLNPMSSFGIQVKGTGGTATAWDVRLEGSLDNTNWSTILNHTTNILDGVVLWSGAAKTPTLYVRSKVVSITLGAASNLVVTLIGTP